MHLSNNFTVITSRHRRRAPTNEALQASLGLPWRGNVLVLRHGRRCPMSVTNIHSCERTLVDYIVQEYVLLPPPPLTQRHNLTNVTLQNDPR